MRYIVRVDALSEVVEELHEDGQDFAEVELCETDEHTGYVLLHSWKAGERDRQTSKLYVEK